MFFTIFFTFFWSYEFIIFIIYISEQKNKIIEMTNIKFSMCNCFVEINFLNENWFPQSSDKRISLSQYKWKKKYFTEIQCYSKKNHFWKINCLSIKVPFYFLEFKLENVSNYLTNKKKRFYGLETFQKKKQSIRKISRVSMLIKKNNMSWTRISSI